MYHAERGLMALSHGDRSPADPPHMEGSFGISRMSDQRSPFSCPNAE